MQKTQPLLKMYLLFKKTGDFSASHVTFRGG